MSLCHLGSSVPGILSLLALLLATAPLPSSAQAPAQKAVAPARVLTLEEALRHARDHQPTLLRQRAETERARARSSEARASLLPQVAARASVTRSSGGAGSNFVAPDGTVATGGARTFYSGSLGVDQQLYDFGRTYGRWRSSQAQARAQEQSTLAAELDVLLGVSQAYFTARAQRSLVEVALETLANQERHLKRVEAFIEVGTRPEIDRAQARTDVANARVQLIQAENAYEVAKARLNQAMGLERPAPYEIGDPSVATVDGEDAPAERLVDEAISQRPELAALREQLEAQRQSRRAAVGGYFPSLGASLNAVESGRELDALRFSWTAGLTLSWPLFDGLATPARVREASFGLVSLESEVARERQQITLELEEARLSLRAAKATLDAATEALNAARERLRLAEGRYETGVGPLLELSDAQLAVTAAAAQRIQAEYDLASSRQELKALLGRPLLP